MKNCKKSIFSMLGLSVLFITGFSASGIAALWPGDGGSSPPPDPPVLSQPTDPDYGGIIDLHWSEPSGPYPIQSYKVYISDSENGNYDRITTTTSRSYTDTRTSGTWWYYVKAYDGHLTSDPSNKVSAEVLPVIRWYDPGSIDVSDMDNWDSAYTSWVEEFTRTTYANGTHPGNLFTVSFVPQIYEPSASYYSLEYALNVHVETNPGDVVDGWPQPTVAFDQDDFYSKPFAIRSVKIETAFIPIQPHETRLWFFDISQNTFLGDYYFTCPEGDMYNEIWNGGFTGLNFWEKYGTEKGSIATSTSYGYQGEGVRILNNLGGPMGIYSREFGIDYKIYFDPGRRNVNINYWGKRISSDSGNNVGVKLFIEYYDGTSEWCFPDNLRLFDCTGIWTHHQYSLEASKDIYSVWVYVVNDEVGSAYFDNIFIPYGHWQFDPKGDWLTGNYDDNGYNDWVNQMNAIQAQNGIIDHVATAIEIGGELAQFIPKYGAIISTIATGAGFFLNAMKKEVPQDQVYGDSESPLVFNGFKYGTEPISIDGLFTTTIASDCSMSYRGELWRQDVDEYDIRSIAITVTVEWQSPCTIFSGFTGGNLFDSASATLIIDCSDLEWIP